MASDSDKKIIIRCLAIDDEPLALMQLKMMIERIPYLQLSGACSDAIEAREMMKIHEVDAIFIDINMPELNGLDFVASLDNPPLVVFTTAYSEYAIDSYKVNAIDYLLKPFGMEEFQKSAEKVKRQFHLLETEQKMLNSEESAILSLRVASRTVLVKINEIRYIESMREYLRIHLTNGERLMTLMPISKIITILEEHGFIRVHRSYIVNTSLVQEIARNNITLDNGTSIPIGDSFKDGVKAMISV